MNQTDAETELNWRLYRWSKQLVAREVAEDFPFLQACQHNRHARCFLAWMREMPPKERLPISLSLVKIAHKKLLAETREECTSLDEMAFKSSNDAYSRYHLIMTGFAWSQFSLIGKSHERICASSVRAVTEVLLSNVPTFIAGLGVND